VICVEPDSDSTGSSLDAYVPTAVETSRLSASALVTSSSLACSGGSVTLATLRFLRYSIIDVRALSSAAWRSTFL
jgi:hypothetical protein